MQLKRLGALGIAVILLSCEREHRDAPAIIIDDWYNVDFAKQLCSNSAENEKQLCDSGAQMGVRAFESRMYSAAASDASCRGLTFYVWNTASNVKEPKHHWTLLLDFVVGNKIQAWTIEPDYPNPVVAPQGDGSPQQIVHTICLMAAHVGADILQ